MWSLVTAPRALACACLLGLVGAASQVSAEQISPELSSAQLASMGLSHMQPMTAAEGHQVRGNKNIWDSFNAVGIPIGFGGGRLVAILNWAYHPNTPDVPTLIFKQLLETQDYPELVPSGPREF